MGSNGRMTCHVHGGAGESLTAARAPRYLTTRRGRVALVSAATRFQAMSLASDPFGIVPARPGVNGLRTTKSFGVRPDELRSLAAVRDSLPPASLHHTARKADARDGSVTLGGTAFTVCDVPSVFATPARFPQRTKWRRQCRSRHQFGGGGRVRPLARAGESGHPGGRRQCLAEDRGQPVGVGRRAKGRTCRRGLG